MTLPGEGTGPVGVYVHHHGGGHLAHATALRSVLGDRLVGFGSGPDPGWDDRWVSLPRDDEPLPGPGVDPTRGGAWHWAPPGHAGYAERMRVLARWISYCRPAAFLVDVSVEVTVLASLLGVRTATVLLHGERTDRAHRAALAVADVVVAPWPDHHRRRWHDELGAKLVTVGLLSRFDGLVPAAGPDGDGRVLVVVPGGDHGFTVEAIEAAARVSGRPWDVVGPLGPGRPTGHGSTDPVGPGAGAAGTVTWRGPVADPWPLLCRAAVVVCTAGAGTVAEVAAARRPAVVLPQDRPFDEQHALAGGLAGGAPVEVVDRWPSADRWPDLLDRVEQRDPAGWSAWHDGRGAERLAAAVLAGPG